MTRTLLFTTSEENGLLFTVCTEHAPDIMFVCSFANSVLVLATVEDGNVSNIMSAALIRNWQISECTVTDLITACLPIHRLVKFQLHVSYCSQNHTVRKTSEAAPIGLIIAFNIIIILGIHEEV